MNRKLDLHAHEKDQYSVEYVDTSRIKISPVENGGGVSSILISTFGRQWEYTQSQYLDISKLGIGGLIDGVNIQSSSLYLLWLVFRSNINEPYGFALTKRPQAMLSSIGSGGALGSSLTCDVTNNIQNTAYQFTIGARVSVYLSESEYNLGTVTSITDGNTIVIQLDNDSSYGTALSTSGHTIKQLDKFRPYDVGKSFSDAAQSMAYENYKLLDSCVLINSASEIDQIIRYEDLIFDGGVQLVNQNNSLGIEKKPKIRYDDINLKWQMSQGAERYYEIMPNVLRNPIINGNFNIWQRGTSFTSVANATVTADRFWYLKSGSMVHDITRDTDVPSNQQFYYSYKVDCTTADSSMAATDLCALRYGIEGYDFRPFVGKRVTFSFWVKAVKTGIYCIKFRNSGADRCYIAEYTINSASTWERKDITLDFNYSGGTWDYINGAGLYIYFTLCAGSNYNAGTNNAWQNTIQYATANQVNGCDSTDNNFWLAGIQLHEGDRALQYIPRPFETELALCQRYYEKNFDFTTAPANNAATDIYVGTAYNSDYVFATASFKVRKRTNTPALTFYQPLWGGAANVWDYLLGGWTALSSITYDQRSETQFTIKGTKTGVFTTGNAYLVKGGWTADCEL